MKNHIFTLLALLAVLAHMQAQMCFAKQNQDKVTICHATSSETNPYVRIVIDVSGKNGHFDNNGTPESGHEDDILILGEADCPGGSQEPTSTPIPTTEPTLIPTVDPTSTPSPTPTTEAGTIPSSTPIPTQTSAPTATPTSSSNSQSSTSNSSNSNSSNTSSSNTQSVSKNESDNILTGISTSNSNETKKTPGEVLGANTFGGTGTSEEMLMNIVLFIGIMSFGYAKKRQAQKK